MAGSIDLTPVVIPWKVYAGDRNAEQFQLEATEGIPWDLTGAIFKSQARKAQNDSAIAIEAVITIDDAVGGLITVEWDGELIRTLLGTEISWAGVYDLEILEAGQTLPITLFTGPFTAALDVTRQ